MGRQNGEKLIVDPNNGNIVYCWYTMEQAIQEYEWWCQLKNKLELNEVKIAALRCCDFFVKPLAEVSG
jgi:hypothetical protein